MQMVAGIANSRGNVANAAGNLFHLNERARPKAIAAFQRPPQEAKGAYFKKIPPLKFYLICSL